MDSQKGKVQLGGRLLELFDANKTLREKLAEAECAREDAASAATKAQHAENRAREEAALVEHKCARLQGQCEEHTARNEQLAAESGRMRERIEELSRRNDDLQRDNDWLTEANIAYETELRCAREQEDTNQKRMRAKETHLVDQARQIVDLQEKISTLQTSLRAKDIEIQSKLTLVRSLTKRKSDLFSEVTVLRAKGPVNQKDLEDEIKKLSKELRQVRSATSRSTLLAEKSANPWE
eukprot:GEMP01037528.1.p1 GENE.GEMP01037528.1~~GEMP01037528.1.p1  ORF type:complete len:237 (+),score=60.34 GEMP01037528.1:62-772(+)